MRSWRRKGKKRPLPLTKNGEECPVLPGFQAVIQDMAAHIAAGEWRGPAIPSSIAIAGIHGYIGSLIYRAALDLQIPRIYGLDPGPLPDGFPTSDRLVMMEDEAAFYEAPADLFHIATHPEMRSGVYHLLRRDARITVEKPMTHPAYPDESCRVRAAARQSNASLLFDFVEAFSQSSLLLCCILRQLERDAGFRIRRIHCERGKDREDARNPRNYKVIVPIQYQETAHCLALALLALGGRSSFARTFPKGISVTALSAPYEPPNPEAYFFGPVDGKVVANIAADGLNILLETDFKRRHSAPFKRFAVTGDADGRSITIEAVFDGCSEKVIVDGRMLAATTSRGRHQEIILNAWRHHSGRAGDEVRPDAEFAWLVFGLSAALWTSCQQGQVLHVKTEDDLREVMQHYPRRLARLARYPRLEQVPSYIPSYSRRGRNPLRGEFGSSSSR
jgi:hypothetical protein